MHTCDSYYFSDHPFHLCELEQIVKRVIFNLPSRNESDFFELDRCKCDQYKLHVESVES